MTTIRKWRLSLVASSLLAAFGTAIAQQPAGTPSKAQAAPTPDIQSADPKSMVGPAPVRKATPFSAAQQAQQPLQLGSFDFYPEISVAEMWDSNVFAENENLDPTSDWAMLTSLQATLKSNWDRHALNFAGGADWTNYRGEQVGAFLNTKSQNTTDWRVSGEGRYDFSSDSNVYGGLRFARDHESLESKDQINGIDPTIYYNSRAYGGYFRQFDQVSMRIAGQAQYLNFDDNTGIDRAGTVFGIENDARDRWRYTGGIRLGYGLSPTLEPFVQVALDNRRYEETTDVVTSFNDTAILGTTALNRDSDGTRALFGARYVIPGVLKAEGFAGWIWQRYESPLESVSTPGFGGSLAWAVAENTRLNAYLDRTVEETNVFQTSTDAAGITTANYASGYINTFAGATLEHSFTPSLGAYANLSFSRGDFKGIDRTDDYTGAGIGGWYRLAKFLYLDLSYQYRTLDSSSERENYDRDQVYIRLTVPLSK